MARIILLSKTFIANAVLIVFVLGINLPVDVFGQSSVQIKGIIKSKQGAIQQAQVDFLNLNDDFLSNSISGTDGTFKSQARFAVGKSIRIRVSLKGYKTLAKDIRINSTGNAGEFMLERSNLIISGFVRDSISGLALPAVEISFYNDAGKLITAKSTTDSRGYFDIETGFVFGQRITVRAFKKGYYDDKEYSQTFSSEGRTSLPDILLPELGARGLRAFIRIKNKRTGKSLGGANVHFLDRKKSKYIDSLVPSSGELELKLYQRPGTTLDMQITRPYYHSITANPTLSEDPQVNQFTYSMERESRSSLGPILLIGSGAAALASGGMFFASKSQYDRYKNLDNYHSSQGFDNKAREDDYNEAQLKRDISVAAGGVAAAALAGYIIYKIKEKNKERALERKQTRTSVNWVPSSNSSNQPGNTFLSISYQF